jgi:excisionase family DNA binding protein
MQEDEFMSVHDAAIYLSLSHDRVRRLVEIGVLDADGMNGSQVRRADVEAYRDTGNEAPGDGAVNDLVRDNDPHQR